MGRGFGGYNAVRKDGRYTDTKNIKVKDKGAVYVAEQYLKNGYRVVFRHEGDRENVKTYDLVIKTTDNATILDRVEVKRITSKRLDQIGNEIKRGFRKFNNGYSGTVELYFPELSNDLQSREFVQHGIDYANRQGYIKGPIRIWFLDGTNIIYSYNGREPILLKKD